MPVRLGQGGHHSDPYEEFRRAQNELLGRRQGRGWPATQPDATSEYPPLDIWLGEHDAIVFFEVPGVPVDSLDITVHGTSLTLQGERVRDPAYSDASAHRRERAYGKFGRTVEMPFEIERDKVLADYRNGILKIFLPRPESDRPRRIKISSS